MKSCRAIEGKERITYTKFVKIHRYDNIFKDKKILNFYNEYKNDEKNKLLDKYDIKIDKLMDLYSFINNFFNKYNIDDIEVYDVFESINERVLNNNNIKSMRSSKELHKIIKSSNKKSLYMLYEDLYMYIKHESTFPHNVIHKNNKFIYNKFIVKLTEYLMKNHIYEIFSIPEKRNKLLE